MCAWGSYNRGGGEGERDVGVFALAKENLIFGRGNRRDGLWPEFY